MSCNSLINLTPTKLHFCSQRRMFVHIPNTTSHSNCYSGFALFLSKLSEHFICNYSILFVHKYILLNLQINFYCRFKNLHNGTRWCISITPYCTTLRKQLSCVKNCSKRDHLRNNCYLIKEYDPCKLI